MFAQNIHCECSIVPRSKNTQSVVIGSTLQGYVNKVRYNVLSLKQHLKSTVYVKSNRKAMNRKGAIKRQIPLLKPKREINKYYKYVIG